MPTSSPQHRRRAGRPESALVSPERIAWAALEIAKSAGYEKLTMTRIAGLLGVSPSALYNHVSGKEDILRLLEDELMGGIRISDLPRMDWDEAVRTWARRYLAVFADHTPLIPVIAVLPVSRAPRTLRVYEAIASVLHSAGVPDRFALQAIVSLESLIFGSAYDLGAPSDIFDLGDDDAAAASRFHTAVTAAAVGRRGYSSSAAFDFGLEAIISAIHRTRQA